MNKAQNNIILFDGDCNFCNNTVQFIIKHDPNKIYKFASLQSDFAQKFLIDLHYKSLPDSIFYIENDKIYDRSTAALKIGRNLSKPWNYTYFFILVPRFLRDVVYDIISKKRYSWFGKRDSCMIPSKDILDRFIEDKKTNNYG